MIKVNMGGLTYDVVALYQQTDLCKKMIQDIKKGDELPPIEFYKTPNKYGEYTIANGIHRFCSYLYLGFEFNYKLV